MALLPPAPPVPRNKEQQQTAFSNASFWSDWYERLRTLLNDLATSIDWSIITGTPTTLAGYGITDAAPLSHVGAGGAAHANVVAAGASGFMTGADKTKLDAIDSGIYTPTLTNVANLDASTAYDAQWLQVGSTVTVSAKIDVNPTAAGLVQLGISLPVASNFANIHECAGAAASPGVAGQSAAIVADTANNRAEMEFIAVDLNNRAMYCTFSYTII